MLFDIRVRGRNLISLDTVNKMRAKGFMSPERAERNPSSSTSTPRSISLTWKIIGREKKFPKVFFEVIESPGLLVVLGRDDMVMEKIYVPPKPGREQQLLPKDKMNEGM